MANDWLARSPPSRVLAAPVLVPPLVLKPALTLGLSETSARKLRPLSGRSTMRLQLDARTNLGSEAHCLHADVVNARLQRRETVIAGCVRGRRAPEISLRI